MNLAHWIPLLVGGIFGLLIGSFLNVVIYRLPQMLYRTWLHDAGASLATSPGENSLWTLVFGPQRAQPEQMEAVGKHVAQAVEALPRFDLMLPASRCQSCGHQIRWFENIPVFSWLVLRGKCSGCGSGIAWRYPAIELVTGLLFAWCGWRWGLTWTGLAWAGFSAMLITMTMIEWDTTLLPDDLTLPLMWAGLLASVLGLTQVSLADSVMGAAAGYLSLWAVYWVFKWITRKEGMGFGDFKLFAALGAWFGWAALAPMILMASTIGVVVGLVLKLRGGLHEGKYVPFGPFLALAGLTAMMASPVAILRAIGWAV